MKYVFILLLLGSIALVSTNDAQANEQECIPVEISYTVIDDVLIQFCKVSDSNILMGTTTTSSEGTASIQVPRKIIDALLGNCESDTLLMLINNVEPNANVTDTSTHRIIDVNLPKGAVKLEIIGSSQLVYPLPTQYCGSSHGYESKFAPPLKQIQSGVPFSNIACNDTKTRIFKYSAMSVSCVNPDTVSKLIQRGWTKIIPIESEIKSSSSFLVTHNNSKYPTWYSIYGAVINSIQKEKDAGYLNIKLKSSHDGHLFIIVSKEIIGEKKLGWDGDFIVLVDGLEVAFRNDRPSISSNTLVIPITAMSKLVQIIPMYPISG
ncbi:hypothetical protein [Nitrosarchaeum sp.]|uniref:hypothetical protein n=1 Tax=Nitrosarchaeum sp. TaxID=2026886 RepID=UPI00247EA243|nr:hypothetical protein [Nitrosarchaeum sp.]MCV0413224.1 hypothetical protein [Nitrosarchaeum sp.]